MQKIIFLLTTIALVAVVACSNKSESEKSNNNNIETESATASTMTCTINGELFTTTQFIDQGSTKFNFSLIGKVMDKLKAVELYFPRDETKVGAVFNYKFKMGETTDNSVTIRQYANSIDELDFKSIGFGTSTITVTKATSNRIEGTFIASSKDINITDGKFSIATNLKW
jgi:hypothetical protein